MKFRVRYLAMTATLALTGATLVTAPSASATTHSVRLTTPAHILLGQHVVVTGSTNTKFIRKVKLQRHAASGWRTVSTRNTSPTGRYRVVDETTSRVGTYRVVAPAVQYKGHRYRTITSTARSVRIYNQLTPGMTLQANRGIVSPHGAYRLLQQADGNLVEYKGTKAIWTASTNGADRWAIMQIDGNFVVYAGPRTAAKAVWSAATQGAAGSHLSLQDDGNIVVYSAGGLAQWSSRGGPTGATQSSLNGAGAINRLSAGQSLISADGSYRAVMQSDGNFVVYNSSGKSIWSTGTAGTPSAYLTNQNDGNVVVYSSGGAAKWSSNTGSASRTVLSMQNDGNLVLYSRGGLPLWSSKGGRTGFQQDTIPAGSSLSVGQAIYSKNGSYFAVMQGDGNFVKYTSTGRAQWSSNTHNSGADRVAMQGDGNLVVYAGASPKWDSATAGPNTRLIMQDDGNLVVYSGATALWDSADNGAPGARDSRSGIGAFQAWALNRANWNSTTDNGNPGIDVDGAYGAQCADLGIAWSQQSGHRVGFDGWDTSASNKPGWHPVSGNLGSALPGDVITRVGGRQHVVVILGQPSGGHVTVIQQNPGSPATASYSTSTSGVIWRLN